MLCENSNMGMIRRALENAESQLSNTPRIRSISHISASESLVEVIPISEKSKTETFNFPTHSNQHRHSLKLEMNCKFEE